MKNIVLIGLPGSGKTTLGGLLAEKTGRSFADLDTIIEDLSGMTIPSIFAAHGEAHFRALESETARRLSDLEGAVIATGGGTVLSEENVRELEKNGFLVFLDRPVENILSDLKTENRPLLMGGPQALKKLAETRRAIYLDCAGLVLDCSPEIEILIESLISVHAALAATGFAVIGEPISHSLSPVIHGAAFRAQGISESFSALRVPKSALHSFVSALRVSGLKGINVTIPHKSDIIPFLDEVDPEAELCGAVNVVRVRDGKLQGFNTDMGGLKLSLEHLGHGFEGRRVTVLGAGGAARAAALKAALEGAASVHIAARKLPAARLLAEHLRSAAGAAVTFGGMATEELSGVSAESDILINATPLGMSSFEKDFEDLSFFDALPDRALVVDIVYSPPQTKFLKAACARGLIALGGMGMLIFQALLAQEIFLGRRLDRDRLFSAVEAELSLKNKEINL